MAVGREIFSMAVVLACWARCVRRFWSVSVSRMTEMSDSRLFGGTNIAVFLIC